MKTLENVKVFDFNNPNVELVNDTDSILEMLKNAPIIINLVDKPKTIGVVKEDTVMVRGSEFFANVVLFEDYDIKGIFKNYEVTGYYELDKWVVSGISGIELE